ncbi:hypothetical protein ABIC83_002951 [Roseateles asaccharophilus]|uniref:hypothetical protein n=1 Tax=Roseateles asaccharophilus TaxID=582607 RepID=UPI00383877EB
MNDSFVLLHPLLASFSVIAACAGSWFSLSRAAIKAEGTSDINRAFGLHGSVIILALVMLFMWGCFVPFSALVGLPLSVLQGPFLELIEAALFMAMIASGFLLAFSLLMWWACARDAANQGPAQI